MVRAGVEDVLTSGEKRNEEGECEEEEDEAG